MTNEMLVKEFEGNTGKEVLIFLKNNFRYSGTIIDVSDRFVKINDCKCGTMLLDLDNVVQVVVIGDAKK